MLHLNTFLFFCLFGLEGSHQLGVNYIDKEQMFFFSFFLSNVFDKIMKGLYSFGQFK